MSDENKDIIYNEEDNEENEEEQEEEEDYEYKYEDTYEENENNENEEDNEEDNNYEDNNKEEKNNNINKLHVNKEDISLKRLLSYYYEFNNEITSSQLLYRDTVQSQSFFYLYIPIKNLLLDKEHCHALNLDENLSIRIDLVVDFSDSNHAKIKVTRVVNCHPIVEDQISKSDLSWILEHRLLEYIKEFSINLNEIESQQFKIVREVMKNTNCSKSQVIEALKKVKWDVNEATINLLDNNMNSINTNTTIESNNDNINVNNNVNNCVDLTLDNYEDGSLEHDSDREICIRTALEEIHQQYPNVDYEVLSSLFESTEYSYDKTISFLEVNDNLSNSNNSKKLKTSHPIELNQDIKSLIREIISESPHYTAELYENNSNNVFILLYFLIEGEILTCGKRCLICNKKVSYPGIRPVVCGSLLCVMAYEELGVGIDLKNEIQLNPLVIDFFISLLSFGALDTLRKRLDLLFPSTVKAYHNNQERSFLTENENGTIVLNYELLLEVIEKIPSVDDMVNWCETSELKGKLDEIDTLIYPLLLWLVRSNRTYLRVLEKEEIPKGINAKIVFALISGPMEKETQFQKLRLENNESEEKSIFLFHGSALSNWHSILRLGLKNFSNTPFMSNGAAYGPGVYFSDTLSVSSEYCKRFISNQILTTNIKTNTKIERGWQHSQTINLSDNCIAICEIINRSANFSKNGSIYVVKNEEFIATRFLMITPGTDCEKLSTNLNFDNMKQTLPNLHNREK